MNDERIVYGANCMWWDAVDRTSRKPGSGLPCCPHCGSVLFEVPSEEEWWKAVDDHEASGEVGYRAFIEWLRGQCYPNTTAAKSAYQSEQKDS